MYLTAIAVSGVFYLAYQEWFSWFALLIVLGLPWFSLIVSLPAMLRFRAGILSPQRISMGAQAEVKLAGWCELPPPPFRGYVGLKHNFTSEVLRRSAAVAVPTAHCGCVTAEPEKVRVYDYLGLFAFRCKVSEPSAVLVLPRSVEVPDLPELEQFVARAWRPKPGGGFAENHELRLYRPGDSLNQIHWKLTAKTGKLTIREPMEPILGQLSVTMNLRGTPEELDRMLGRLLWVGNHLLGRKLDFTLWVLTGEGPRMWQIRSRKDLEEALDDLLRAQTASEGAVVRQEGQQGWHYHIGGEPV